MFLNSKNAKNGLAFSWTPVLTGYIEITKSEGREDTQRILVRMRSAAILLLNEPTHNKYNITSQTNVTTN